jgi:thermostable 8-oxoguanine DNA glycosylase
VQLEFEICIFTNDKNRNMALKLASAIEDKIKHHSFENVAGIKANKIEFQTSKDLVSNKLVMNYQTLLKQKIIVN